MMYILLMSEIQKKSILPIMSGLDIIGQAQPGTGKTATFTITPLQSINLMFFISMN